MTSGKRRWVVVLVGGTLCVLAGCFGKVQKATQSGTVADSGGTAHSKTTHDSGTTATVSHDSGVDIQSHVTHESVATTNDEDASVLDAGELAFHDSGTGLPVCAWPARYDLTNRPLGTCGASRKALTCTSPDGTGVFCASDGDYCESAPEIQPCTSYCAADEYVIYCGSFLPPPDSGLVIGESDPEPNCGNAFYTPAGVFMMCCPCAN